jgi:lysyl-tRNA synthetase class 2
MQRSSQKKTVSPVHQSNQKLTLTSPKNPSIASKQAKHPPKLRSFSTKQPTPKQTKKPQQLTEAELTAQADAPTVQTSYAISHTVYSNTRAHDFETLQTKYPSFTPYPESKQPTMTIGEFCGKYHGIENGARLREENNITINGRIFTKRSASQKLSFVDIGSQDGSFKRHQVQVMCSAFNMDEQSLDVSKIFKKGDWISVTGFPGKSDTGELSIIANNATLLSPSLQYPPTSLIDPNLRFRARHLDLFVNRSNVMEIFRVRTSILKQIRNYLDRIDFVEVETPILWTQAGGATARPFLTNSNAFGEDLPLSLRIAPELFLKQLVIGGMERVYEIGKVFRNEGIDATHSPEFTSCELYQAHANYETMMDFTEDLLRTITKNITGKLSIKILPPGINGVDTPQEFQRLNSLQRDQFEANNVKEIDFSQPFKRLDVIQTLRENGIELPPNYNDDESLPQLREICHQRGWTLKPPFTVARCLDTMISEIIEPMCIQPTYIINHPVALSPLAKRSSVNPMLTERFELFINSKEYANAYTELNIPSEQLDRFTAQQRQKTSLLKAAQDANDDSEQTAKHNQDFIDEEAHPVDLPYCEALQTALPPLAGWGLGIDRLVMLLSQQHNIRDVLFFPIMKPQLQSGGGKSRTKGGDDNAQ